MAVIPAVPARFTPLRPRRSGETAYSSVYMQNLYILRHRGAGDRYSGFRRRGRVIDYTIFSGRTVSSNSSAVRRPRDNTASFRVVPSERAFLAHLAAAS